MTTFDNMGEFRSALSDLVNNTGISNPQGFSRSVLGMESEHTDEFQDRLSRNPRPKKGGRMARKNSQARRNMAMEFDGIRFDSLEELLAYKRAVGGGGASAAFAPPGHVAPTAAAWPPAPAAPAPRRRARKTREVREPGGAVSYGQGKIIGLSVGGFRSYCPSVMGTKTSHAEALTQMGLNRGSASAVIEAMQRAGVIREHRGIPWSPEKSQRAIEILEQVGGISCPVPKTNPRYGRF